MADDFAKIERRIKDLESVQAATLRFGEVNTVDANGSATVRIDDAKGTVSGPLRVLQSRTVKDQEQDLPDPGQQVAVLLSGQGYEQGVVLGGVYSAKNPSPGRPPHVWYRKFEDGTEIEYDRQAHKLTMNVNGDITIKASGIVKINAAHVSIQE